MTDRSTICDLLAPPPSAAPQDLSLTNRYDMPFRTVLVEGAKAKDMLIWID
jgi:hypothetical protein